MLKGIAIGTVASMVMMLLGIGAVSSVVISGKIEIGTARNILRILLSVAVLLGIKAGNSLTIKEPAIHTLFQCAAIMIILTGVHIFTCDTKFQYVGGTLLYIFIGALCAMVIKPRSKTVRKSRNR
jgi:hypothetical protein